MAYDYSKLEGRIKEKFGTQAKFAEAINLSARSLSLKLNSIRGFKQDEISVSCRLLDIDHTEIPAYFFTLKVQAI